MTSPKPEPRVWNLQFDPRSHLWMQAQLGPEPLNDNELVLLVEKPKYDALKQRCEVFEKQLAKCREQRNVYHAMTDQSFCLDQDDAELEAIGRVP